MISIVEAYRAGLFERKHWWTNILSGLIVGVVALPLAMAFAIASGVKPEQGIYTSIIAGIAVAAFGGSRVQIAGPTGAFVVILAQIVAKYGVSGLQVATLFAGLILIFMGFIRLGSVIKFIPDPVIVGFTAGIGIIIFVGEWKDFFGLTISLPLDAHFHQKLFALIRQLPHLNLATTGLGILSLVLVLITPKINNKIPGPLVAMVAATVLDGIFNFDGVATIGSTFGGISQSLPTLSVPKVPINQLLELIGPAFTIALLGSLESLLSATAADGMAGTRHNSNQELIGQGIANVLTPLFGGFAATGAIARTATNIRNHGNSPLSAIVYSLFLLAILLLLAPLAADIPLCTLAAILFIVAYNMSDFPYVFHIIKKAPRYDTWVLLITFALTIFVNLVVAVYIGVTISMLFFIKRMGEMVTVIKESKQTESLDITNIPDDVLVYTIQGPFFFGAAEKIEHILAVNQNTPSKIILRLKYVPFMDMTGLSTLEEIIEQYTKRNVQVYMCEANPIVLNKLKKSGVIANVVHNKVFDTLNDALNTVNL